MNQCDSVWTNQNSDLIYIYILIIYIYNYICIHPQAECPAFHSPPHSRLEHRWAGHGFGQHLRHEARVVAVDAGRGHAASLVPGSAGVGCFTKRGAENMGWSSPNQWRIYIYICVCVCEFMSLRWRVMKLCRNKKCWCIPIFLVFWEIGLLTAHTGKTDPYLHVFLVIICASDLSPKRRRTEQELQDIWSKGSEDQLVPRGTELKWT